LEWLYENKTNTINKTKIDNSNSPVEMLPPPKEVLQQLLELAQDGDIQKILEMAQQISVSDEQSSPFMQQLAQLASNFQLKRLETFLKQHIN
jgi:hypothetical protein